MNVNGRAVRTHLAAFGLLFGVSLYRQVSLRLTPGDLFRSWILFFVYAPLLLLWGASLCLRVTQKTMRRCLLLECCCMAAALFIRFLQDTFWTGNLLLMRVSGLVAAAFLFPLMLLGLYAALGIGQPDGWRLPARWKAAALPVFFFVWLLVTDESRHFYFYLIPEEPQPNLSFHPAPGFFLAFALGILLAFLRILVIFRRNRRAASSFARRILTALMEPILLTLVSLPFLLVSLNLAPFLAGKEVLELFAKVFYVEILTWEIYIALGLVPVNTRYQSIFEHSTAAMQILREDGSRIRSAGAPEIAPEQLEQLQKRGILETEDGQELHLYPIPGGQFLWLRDTSRQRELLQELEQTTERLSQENQLLEEELRIRNRETGTALKNQIYSELTEEIRPQLAEMKTLVKTLRNESGLSAKQGQPENLWKLCLLGTFVKRHCYLRLIREEQGRIAPVDLADSFREMARVLEQTGCTCCLQLSSLETPDSRQALDSFDALEKLLEQNDFSLKRLVLTAYGSRIVMSAECPQGEGGAV